MSQQADVNLSSIYLISTVSPALRVWLKSPVVWVVAMDQMWSLLVDVSGKTNIVTSVLIFNSRLADKAGNKAIFAFIVKMPVHALS